MAKRAKRAERKEVKTEVASEVIDYGGKGVVAKKRPLGCVSKDSVKEALPGTPE